MVRAAESNPAIAIQYKMVDQWKEIAGEQVKACLLSTSQKAFEAGTKYQLFAVENDNWNANYLQKTPSKNAIEGDDKLRIKIKGEVQQNLFAAGSVLSGSNTIHEGCGAGVSMLTALFVADNLIKG